MTTDELLRTILPHLDRSWVGVKRFGAGAAVRTPVLRGIQTDTVAGRSCCRSRIPKRKGRKTLNAETESRLTVGGLIDRTCYSDMHF